MVVSLKYPRSRVTAAQHSPAAASPPRNPSAHAPQFVVQLRQPVIRRHGEAPVHAVVRDEHARSLFQRLTGYAGLPREFRVSKSFRRRKRSPSAQILVGQSAGVVRGRIRHTRARAHDRDAQGVVDYARLSSSVADDAGRIGDRQRRKRSSRRAGACSRSDRRSTPGRHASPLSVFVRR